MEPRLEIGKRPAEVPPPPVVEAPKQAPKPPRPMKFCRRCSEEIPAVATYCRPCGSYQDWRVFVPGSSIVLSLLLALFSVLGTIAPKVGEWMHRNSETSVLIVDGDKDDLCVAVSNDGNRPAMLRGFELTFEGIALPPQELVLKKGTDALIMPRENKLLRLSAGQFKPAAGHTAAEVQEAIASGKVTLTARVQESTDASETTTLRTDRTPARQIGSWIIEMMGDV
jgi:ribosomal protein L40E